MNAQDQVTTDRFIADVKKQLELQYGPEVVTLTTRRILSKDEELNTCFHRKDTE